MLDENEKNYGEEIRQKYGDETVSRSNAKFQNMTQLEYETATKLGEEVLSTLADAFKNGDPAGALAQKAADLHKQWLCCYWESYSKQAHAGLARMYVEDERFKAYYDKIHSGIAQFLCDAILVYTSR